LKFQKIRTFQCLKRSMACHPSDQLHLYKSGKHMNKETKLGYLNINTSLYQTRISTKFENRKPYKPKDPKIILSFIPGTVVDIFVSEGQEVKKGDTLMILDAMKMKNMLKCNMDGRIKSIAVKKGARVSKGTVLVVLE
jgi:biotin carboxyl carrier protein